MTKILFGKSKWEMSGPTVEEFLDCCVRDGFDSVEVLLSALPAGQASRVGPGAVQRGLFFVGQVLTEGTTPDEHASFLDRHVRTCIDAGAAMVSVHTGRDHFPFAENVKLFELARGIQEQTRVPVIHETHRGRALFSAPSASAYLRALPFLRLTLDLSHWVNVHESDLSDQPEAVALAIDRADCVHARVGHSEGPQVPHPLAPEWSAWLELHVGWWRRALDTHRARGSERLIITPEAGPPTYMPTLPFTNQPVADAWTVNVQMKDYLKRALAVG